MGSRNSMETSYISTGTNPLFLCQRQIIAFISTESLHWHHISLLSSPLSLSFHLWARGLRWDRCRWTDFSFTQNGHRRNRNCAEFPGAWCPNWGGCWRTCCRLICRSRCLDWFRTFSAVKSKRWGSNAILVWHRMVLYKQLTVLDLVYSSVFARNRVVSGWKCGNIGILTEAGLQILTFQEYEDLEMDWSFHHHVGVW